MAMCCQSNSTFLNNIINNVVSVAFLSYASRHAPRADIPANLMHYSVGGDQLLRLDELFA